VCAYYNLPRDLNSPVAETDGRVVRIFEEILKLRPDNDGNK